MSDPDAATFRDAMSRLGSAVHVITTRTSEVRHGLTASAVCSVTDAPPTLLFCLNRTVSSRDAFFVGGPACVNTLSGEQSEISAVFSDRRRIEQRFALGRWTTLATGAPVLEGAVVSFDCRISQIVEFGTHSVVFAEVVAVQLGANAPILIYLGRAYHQLPMEAVD